MQIKKFLWVCHHLSIKIDILNLQALNQQETHNSVTVPQTATIRTNTAAGKHFLPTAHQSLSKWPILVSNCILICARIYIIQDSKDNNYITFQILAIKWLFYINDNGNTNLAALSLGLHESCSEYIHVFKNCSLMAWLSKRSPSSKIYYCLSMSMKISKHKGMKLSSCCSI